MPRLFPSRLLVSASLGCLLALTVPCLAAKAAPPAKPAPPVLPAAFGQWRQTAEPASSTSPSDADPVNAAALKEYGLQRLVSATYADAPASGDTLGLRALQFPDATGAYGAFTFYLKPGMRQEEIGMEAASEGSHVLFWQGSILVDAQFHFAATLTENALRDQMRIQLRELALVLPKPSGSASVPPPLPGYLPPMGLEKGTARYALGPASYTQSGGVLPPALVNFDLGTETLTAQYNSRDGKGTLTLLSYPTSELAAAQERTITAFLTAGNSPQAAWPPALAASSPQALAVHRSGPLLSIASGEFSAAEAQRMVHLARYQADITWNHPQGYMSDAYRAARLYLAIFALVGILGAAAILLGLFLGGGRALYRVMRGKPASTMNDIEFISLDLRTSISETRSPQLDPQLDPKVDPQDQASVTRLP